MPGIDFLLMFVLAHFIGDFVLQTNRIASMKSANVKGIGIHVSIVILVQIIMLSALGPNAFPAAVMVGLVHFFIDWVKLYIQAYIGRAQFLYFIFDQIVHIGIIVLAVWFFEPYSPLTAGAVRIVKFAIALITLTYISSVAAKILLKDIFAGLAEKVFFYKGERPADAALAVALWLLWLVSPYMGAAASFFGFWPYRVFQYKFYSYTMGMSLTKYLLIAVFSFICHLL